MKRKTNQQTVLFYSIYVVIIFLLQSCGTVYTSSSYGNLQSYVAKQEYRNKDTVANYVSAHLSLGRQDRADFEDDHKFLASFQAHRAITKKYYNYYFGIGGGYGAHTLHLKDLNDRFNVYNFSVKSGFNLNLPRPKVDWRFVGLEFGYTNEFGSYMEKLDDIKQNDLDAIVFNRRNIWHYHINSEVIFKFSKGKTFGIGLFFGDIFSRTGELKEYGSGFGGGSLSYKFNKYTISLSNEVGNEGIGSTKFSITYQFSK